jgi:plasmid stabilization system protein ParE
MADRILQRVELLADFPELGHVVAEARDEQVREVIEGPYRIIYLAQPSRVDVLAIVHGRQLLDWPK